MFIRINLQSSVGRQCSCLKDAAAFKTFKFLWGLGIFPSEIIERSCSFAVVPHYFFYCKFIN